MRDYTKDKERLLREIITNGKHRIAHGSVDDQLMRELESQGWVTRADPNNMPNDWKLNLNGGHSPQHPKNLKHRELGRKWYGRGSR